MFALMVIIFVLGYTAIALEHPLKIDKAASALITGTLLWAIYALNHHGLLELDLSPAWHHITGAANDVISFVKPNVGPNAF